MTDLLLWLYLANSVLLINHEIDSAYWKEWELFNLPGGITGFLLLHFPLLLFILWGLILISRHSCQRSFQSEPFSVVKSEPPLPPDKLVPTPSFPTFPRSL